MAIKHWFCVNHPDRAAIGVCVVTAKAICAECSTRYEGVNYSKEGLRILKERRAVGARKGGARDAILRGIALVLFPCFLYLLYLFYRVSFTYLMKLN